MIANSSHFLSFALPKSLGETPLALTTIKSSERLICAISIIPATYPNMPSIPGFQTNTPLHPSFDKDIRDTHLIYDYDAQDENGNPEKWRYEMWFFSEDRIVYAIHGGT